MGLLWAGAGITAGVGAMLAGHWGSIHRERRFMVLVPASAAAILDVTLLPNLPMLVAGFAFIGLVSGPIDVAVLSRASAVPTRHGFPGRSPFPLASIPAAGCSGRRWPVSWSLPLTFSPRFSARPRRWRRAPCCPLGRTRPTPSRRGFRPPGLTRPSAR